MQNSCITNIKKSKRKHGSALSDILCSAALAVWSTGNISAALTTIQQKKSK